MAPNLGFVHYHFVHYHFVHYHFLHDLDLHLDQDAGHLLFNSSYLSIISGCGESVGGCGESVGGCGESVGGCGLWSLLEVVLYRPVFSPNPMRPHPLLSCDCYATS